jgi:hypothetical protein
METREEVECRVACKWCNKGRREKKKSRTSAAFGTFLKSGCICFWPCLNTPWLVLETSECRTKRRAKAGTGWTTTKYRKYVVGDT